MRLLETADLKREEMSKKNDETPRPDFVWRLNGDAMRPKEAPWGFVAQNPVQRAIPAGQKILIDTGISASVPMIASARGDQADYVTVPMLIPAGRNVVVTVENRSQHMPLVIDDREALVNLTPLLFHGTSEVD